jgi:hypothetical protein
MQNKSFLNCQLLKFIIEIHFIFICLSERLFCFDNEALKVTVFQSRNWEVKKKKIRSQPIGQVLQN